MSLNEKRAFDRARNHAFHNYVGMLIKNGHSYHEIAIDLAISMDQLTEFINLVNEQLMADEIRKVNQLKKKGFNNSLIAKHLGITEAAVRKIMIQDDLNKAPKEKSGKQTS